MQLRPGALQRVLHQIVGARAVADQGPRVTPQPRNKLDQALGFVHGEQASGSGYSTLFRRVRQWRQAAQVRNNRSEILGGELARGIAHHFAHGVAHHVAVGEKSALQDVLQFAVAVTLESRRRKVGRARTFAELRAGEEAILFRGTEPIARRVAFAAMPECLHKISAAVHEHALTRIGLEWPGAEEQPLPDEDQKAPAIQDAELVRPAGLRARPQRAQISPQIAQVGVVDACERRVRKGRKIMRAIGSLAFTHRAHEVGLRPASEPGDGMRRDVRPVKSAEGRLQRAASRIRHSVFARVRVATDAAARPRNIAAAPRVALLCKHAEGAQQKKKPRHSGAFPEPQRLLFLAEALLTAPAGFADGADLRLHRGFVTAAAHFVELVRLILEAALRLLELIGLLIDRPQPGALYALPGRVVTLPRHPADVVEISRVAPHDVGVVGRLALGHGCHRSEILALQRHHGLPLLHQLLGLGLREYRASGDAERQCDYGCHTASFHAVLSLWGTGWANTSG